MKFLSITLILVAVMLVAIAIYTGSDAILSVSRNIIAGKAMAFAAIFFRAAVSITCATVIILLVTWVSPLIYELVKSNWNDK